MHRTIYCLTRDADHPPLLFDTEQEAQAFLNDETAESHEDALEYRPYLGGPYAVVVPATLPEFDRRELATMLAALRCLQKCQSEAQDDLADLWPEHFAECEPLCLEAIDALCERLNTSTPGQAGTVKCHVCSSEFDPHSNPHQVVNGCFICCSANFTPEELAERLELPVSKVLEDMGLE